MIEDPLGCIDYDETGNGPTVVLVPGSCSTGAVWRPISAQLGNRFRCVTTSLLGYGGTAERRTVADTGIAREAEIVEAVIRRAGGPVHLAGHSFGGLTALAVALRRQVPLLSLTIAEAPGPEILRTMGEYGHYFAFRKMTTAYSEAFQFGNKTAIEQMIDFYGGAGTFAGWPQSVRDYAVETTPVNLMDWKTVYDFALTPAMLASVRIPTLVLVGATSSAAIKRVNSLLALCMPKAAVTTVSGAGHFMISTHAEEVADLIAQHVVGAKDEYLSMKTATR